MKNEELYNAFIKMQFKNGAVTVELYYCIFTFSSSSGVSAWSSFTY